MSVDPVSSVAGRELRYVSHEKLDLSAGRDQHLKSLCSDELP